LLSTAGFSVNDTVFIADCNESAALKISAFAGTNLRHTVGVNSNASVGRAFAEDALVMRFETHAYYVAPSSRNPATETSLWMMIGAAAPVEVVEDVKASDSIRRGHRRRLCRTCCRRTTSSTSQVVALQVTCCCAVPLQRGQDHQLRLQRPDVCRPTDTRRVYTATIQLRNRTL
jgi:hypothetical protein